MLNLHSRIHLHEIVLTILIDEELHRARVPVFVHREQTTGISENTLSRLARQSRGGRSLDDLLMPTLDAAIPIVEMHDVAVAIPEALDLDVPRPIDVLLHEAPAVPERVQCLVASEAEHAIQVGRRWDDAYPASAPAHRGLDDDGVRDGILRVIYPRLGLLGRGECGIGSGDDGHIG